MNSIAIYSSSKPSDVGYTGNVVLLNESPRKWQVFFDNIIMFGARFQNATAGVDWPEAELRSSRGIFSAFLQHRGFYWQC